MEDTLEKIRGYEPLATGFFLLRKAKRYLEGKKSVRRSIHLNVWRSRLSFFLPSKTFAG